MRRKFKYDADADMIYEVGSNYYDDRPRGPSVISDDVGAGVNGLRHMPSGRMLDSKSAHRRENKARGLVEVGNDTNFASAKAPLPSFDGYARAVRDATEQLQSNWNGTADQRRREREERR